MFVEHSTAAALSAASQFCHGGCQRAAPSLNVWRLRLAPLNFLIGIVFARHYTALHDLSRSLNDFTLAHAPHFWLPTLSHTLTRFTACVSAKGLPTAAIPNTTQLCSYLTSLIPSVFPLTVSLRCINSSMPSLMLAVLLLHHCTSLVPAFLLAASLHFPTPFAPAVLLASLLSCASSSVPAV